MAEAWDLSSIEKGLKEAADLMREGAADGLEEATKDALSKMQDRVPVRTGALRASGRYEVDRENLTASVGFGSGASADYAILRHESTYAHLTNGQTKFVEVPFVQQVVPTAGQRFAEAIKAKLS